MLLSLNLNARRAVRDDAETQVADDSKPQGTQENGDYNMDEYDIEDYYDDEYGYGSGDGLMDKALNIGRGILNPLKNMFTGGDEEDYDPFEGSAVVDEWWKKWSGSYYDSDLYDTSDEDIPTRYPMPNLNDNGHIEMSAFGFRDTLDEYFDIFVIILSASILLLLSCAAVSRIRNIRYLKKQYGDKGTIAEEEAGALLMTKTAD